MFRLFVPVRVLIFAAALLCCAAAMPVPSLAQTSVPDNSALAAMVDKALDAFILAQADAARAFIAEWNDTAGACNEVYNAVLGNMKAPCRKVRAALRRGTLMEFQQRCFSAGIEHAIEVQDRPVSGDGIDAQVRLLEQIFVDYEKALRTVCSLQAAAGDYPAFAALLREAASYPVSRGFDNFGPMDSMAWWNPAQDPANSSNGVSAGQASLPAVLNGQ